MIRPRTMRSGTIRSLVLLLALSAVGFGCDGGDGVTQFEDDDPDPCRDALAISMGQSLSGQLGTGDCLSPDGHLRDRWSFEVARAMTVQIDLHSSSFDAFLELEDSEGRLLGTNDDWGSLDSRLLVELAPGAYTILVRSLSPSGQGPYTVALAEGPDCSVLGSLSVGATVSGELSADDCPVPWGGVADRWRLELSEPTDLRLDVSAPGFDEIVLVLDENGEFLEGADWEHPRGHARLETSLPAGRWTLAVAGPDAGELGAYELSVAEAPPCTPGTTIRPGQTVEGSIDPDGCSLYGFLPVDSLVLELEEDTDVALELTGEGMEPILILFDEDGNLIGEGGPWATPGRALVRARLAAGSYAVLAGADPFAIGTGEYTLSVEAVTCELAGTVGVGASASGVLDETDCLGPRGSVADLWSLSLEEATTLTLDLTSKVFDPYLILRNEADSVIAQNDDGGVGLNSRIQLTLEAGVYEIAASAFAPGMFGEYELSVTPSSSAAPSKSTAVSSDAGGRVDLHKAASPGRQAVLGDRAGGFGAARLAGWRILVDPVRK